MKKPKLNLSKQGLKDFFFRHTEKIFFGVACGLIVLFGYMGFKTPSFDKTTPKKMLDQTVQADQFIHDDTHWAKLDEHRTADTNPAERIRNAKDVDANSFKISQILGTAVRTRALRRDPAIIAPEGFEVRPIRAQVALKEDSNARKGRPELKLGALPSSNLTLPADQRNEMFVYRTDKNGVDENNRLYTADIVVGMAKINYQQQMKNYLENFQYQRGYDANRDYPLFVGLEVQRKTADTEWKPITAKLYELPERLADPAKELVDDRYLIDNVSLPVPAMLGLDYRQFSMLDDIPIREVEIPDDPTKKKKDEEEVDEDPTDPFGGGSSADDTAAKPDPKKMMKIEEDKEEEITHRLVRFYDLEPKKAGETYFYRLRVWLQDPNDYEIYNLAKAKKKEESKRRGPAMGGDGAVSADGNSRADSGGKKDKGKGGSNKKIEKEPTPLSKRNLSREVRARLNDKRTNGDMPSDIVKFDTEIGADDKNADAKEKIKDLQDIMKYGIATEWVEATEPVTITKGFEYFFAGPVDAPSTVRNPRGGWFSTEEPEATIVANSFQDDLGVFVPATKKQALRGSMLNFEAVTNVLHPLTWEIKDLFESEDRKGVRKGRRFETNAMILDIMGGQRQPFASANRQVFYAPGEMLVMDRSGRIEIRNDIDDTTSYRHANFVSAANDDARKEAEDERRGRNDDDEDDNGRED